MEVIIFLGYIPLVAKKILHVSYGTWFGVLPSVTKGYGCSSKVGVSTAGALSISMYLHRYFVFMVIINVHTKETGAYNVYIHICTPK